MAMNAHQLANTFRALSQPGDEPGKKKILEGLYAILITNPFHPELFRILMPILTSPSVSVRLFLIEVVERACVNDVFGHAAACLATLETCLEDEDVKVRRKACVAATVLFATTFKFLYLLPPGSWTQATTALWNVCQVIKSKIVAFALDSNCNETVRTVAFHFLENIVLIYSSQDFNPENNATCFIASISLDVPDLVRKTHPYINFQSLKSEADHIIMQLVTMLGDVDKSKLNCTSLCTLIMALTRIGMHRVQYSVTNIHALIRVQANPMRLVRSHLKRVQHTLKMMFLAYVKMKPSEELFEAICVCLSKMGFEEDVRNIRKYFKSSVSSSSAPSVTVEEQDAASKVRAENKEASWGGVDPSKPVDESVHTLTQQLSALPVDLAARLVFRSMDNYEHGYDAIPNAPHLISPIDLTIFDQPVDLTTLSLDKMSPQLNAAISLHKFVCVKRQFPALHPRLCTDGIEAAAKSAASLKKSENAQNATRAIPFIPVPVLSLEMRQDLAKQSLARMLTNKTETDLSHSGKGKLLVRSLVLSKLSVMHTKSTLADIDETEGAVIQLDSVSPIIPASITAFFSHIFDSPATRYESVMTVLFTLFSFDSNENLGSNKIVFIEDVSSSTSKTGSATSLKDLVISSNSRFPNYDLAVLRFLVAIEKKLPSTDKLWLTFLNDIPRIPTPVFEFLRRYCVDADRRSNGMIALRELLMYHPIHRAAALEMLLQFCVDDSEQIRSAAIRMVMNKIVIEPMFEKSVIEFAEQQLKVLLTAPLPETEFIPSEGLTLALENLNSQNANASMDIQNEDAVGEMAEAVAALGVVPSFFSNVSDPKKISSKIIASRKSVENIEDFGADISGVLGIESHVQEENAAHGDDLMEVTDPQSVSESSTEQIQLQREKLMKQMENEKLEHAKKELELIDRYIRRHTLLYLPLCLRDNSKFGGLIKFFAEASKPVQKFILSHIQGSVLISKVGASDLLLNELVNSSESSDQLVLQILSTLADFLKSELPASLVSTAEKLYIVRNSDVRFLVPVLGGLKSEVIMRILPKLIDLPNAQNVVERLISLQPISPSDLLVALHTMDPTKESVSMKKILDAAKFCFMQRTVYTQDVLAVILQKLVDRTPVPLMFMRTLIQTLVICPKLVQFAISLLSRLISKKVWEMPQLWEGWCRACEMTQPSCYPIVLQLPMEQFNDILTRFVAIRNGVKNWAKSQPRARIPRTYLVALGLEEEEDKSMETNDDTRAIKKPKNT